MKKNLVLTIPAHARPDLIAKHTTTDEKQVFETTLAGSDAIAMAIASGKVI